MLARLQGANYDVTETTTLSGYGGKDLNVAEKARANLFLYKTVRACESLGLRVPSPKSKMSGFRFRVSAVRFGGFEFRIGAN